MQVPGNGSRLVLQFNSLARRLFATEQLIKPMSRNSSELPCGVSVSQMVAISD
jgi:hypothetical protein